MLPAYLDEGTTALADVAEIAGVSTRTLQRKLAHVGLSYSHMLDMVRYEHASQDHQVGAVYADWRFRATWRAFSPMLQRRSIGGCRHRR
jgi:hypothetical protein